MLASGMHPKEIAWELGLSPSTVRSHLTSARGKVGVPDSVGLMLWWWRMVERPRIDREAFERGRRSVLGERAA